MSPWSRQPAQPDASLHLLPVARQSDEVARTAPHVALDPLTRVVSQGQIACRLESTQPGAVVCVLEINGLPDSSVRSGHLAHDAALRRFGRHLRTRTRRDDFVARAGSDEFLVILEGNIGSSVAYRRMKELALTWAQSERQASTVSIGVAHVDEAGPIVAAVAADRAMYRAKRGTVSVEIAQDESSSSEALTTETYDAYLAGVSSADASKAVAALVWGADRGMSEHDLVHGVISPAQRTAGVRWAAGDWGIAQGQAATLVAEQALTLIAPPTPPSAVATRVVMACAEGESHTMPARLAAHLAKSTELDIIVLGGGMPAADLGAGLRVLAPTVLALSVTMATNLIGAQRCIQAARAEGVRVIVGGAAWGTTQQRAQRLGASLMLTDVTELARHVCEGARTDVAMATKPLDDEAILLERPPSALIESALGLWDSRQPTAAASAEREETRVLLDWIARHAASAVACDDPSVVGDLLQSQIRTAEGDGFAIPELVHVYDALADALALPAPRAAAILRGQTRQLPQQSLVAAV